MKKNILFSIVFLCSILIQSQEINKNDLDELFSDLEHNNKGMGTISICHKGKQIYQNSIGFSVLEHQKKANEFTKYRIASVTKTYTATIILKLVEEGKLNLTSKINEYFPEVPNAAIISIENLLYHRSGLFNITNEKGFSEWIHAPRSRKEMLMKIGEHKPDFNPNEKTAYSNTNYIILSYIAEKIEGKTFSKIIDDRIGKPLQLNSTSFGKNIVPKNDGALSYYFENSKWQPITLTTNLKGPMGAGGIVSTAKEVNTFYSSLFSDKILENKTVKKMTTTKEGLGMGLSVFEYRGMLLYGHNGAMDGFRSIAGYIPEKKLGIVLTFNTVNQLSLSNLLFKILDVYFKNDPDVISTSLIKLKTTDLDKFLGVYSGPTFPLKVTITKKDSTLYAQATGQPLFELIALKENVFKYDVMGIVFTFDEKEQTVMVKFQGKNHLLKKLQ